MFNEKPELIINIPSKTELLKMVVELTRHIVTMNQFGPVCIQQIPVAVDEAITNVIKHSYQYKSDRDIRLEYYTHPEAIKIKIIFSGIPPVFQEQGVDLKKMIKEKKKGGLGVNLMRKIMDSVIYKTEDNVNSCELIKWKMKKS